jgi:hypothetical protein
MTSIITGTRIYIFLDQRYRGQVDGLCGNFDGIYDNEFGIANNNPQEFGNMYKITASCPSISKSETGDMHPCSVSNCRLLGDLYAVPIMWLVNRLLYYWLASHLTFWVNF